MHLKQQRKRKKAKSIMMAHQFAFRLLFLIFVYFSSASSTSPVCNKTVIRVNRDTGNNSICLLQNLNVPCKSLNGLSDCFSGRKDIKVVIESDVILSGVTYINDSRNITIYSENALTIECENSSGFELLNVTGFSFINLTLNNCGVQSFFFYKAALFIRNSSEIKILTTVFSHSNYTALVLLECAGQIELHKVKFISNGVQANDSKQSKYSYAAGVSIEKGNNTSPGNYSFTECQFIKNMSPNNVYSSFANTNPATWRGRGLGGALGIILFNHTKENLVTVNNCTFIGNYGKWGGAIYAHFQDNAGKNVIHIRWTCFKSNVALKSGGAINMGYLTQNSQFNIINITDCHFSLNHALFGGGLALFSQYFNKEGGGEVINIKNSHWFNNTGNLGAAVDITPLDPFEDHKGFLPIPLFENCTFIENKLIDTYNDTNSTIINTGVFIITRFEVHFKFYIKFERNQYTALYILSGSVKLNASTNITFNGNTGYTGGGIALYGFSTLVTSSFNQLEFSNNHAFTKGGGIYYHTMDQHNFMTLGQNCFIRSGVVPDFPLKKSVVFVFKNNTANEGGKSIYSESFEECYRFCLSHEPLDRFIPYNEENTFKCLGNFTFDDKQYALTSSGKKVILKDKHFKIEAIPGSNVHISYNVIDEYNHTIYSLVSIRKEKKGSRGKISLWQPYSFIGTGLIAPRGTPDSQSNFTVTILGVRKFSFTFHVTLLACPPGFCLTKNHSIGTYANSCRCATGSRGYGMVLKCLYDDEFQAYIKTGYWIGYIPENSTSENDLYYAPCPETSCNSNIHRLPNSSTKLAKHICRPNRIGTLCGRCTENTSVYYNSRDFRCGQTHLCNYGLFFYFLSEIIPMVIFFVVVVTLDFSFTSGGTTGFILFSHYVDPIDMQISQLFQYLQTPYRIFYGLFNFEYFKIEQMSFCLWSGFQVLHILTFKYITILVGFSLVLILLVIVQKNACTRLFRLRRRVSAKTSIVNGLSAFLVTCYFQCTRISFLVLKFTTPLGYDSKHEKRYSYYGGLLYLGPQHLIYAVPALISLAVVTIIPPLVLLFYPLCVQFLSLCGLGEHRIVNKAQQITRIDKLLPLIDCFQGCYKNKLRFFAGLYFVYRVAILVCFSFIETVNRFRIYSMSMILLMLGIHSVFRPYKKQMDNTVDLLIFLNLALINMCSIIASTSAKDMESSYEYKLGNSILFVGSLQLVLIYLPMIIAICLVGRRMYLFFKQTRQAHNNEEIEGYCNTLDFTAEDREWTGFSYGSVNR